jgi:hypothetical protein
LREKYGWQRHLPLLLENPIRPRKSSIDLLSANNNRRIVIGITPNALCRAAVPVAIAEPRVGRRQTPLENGTVYVISAAI